MLTSLFLVLLLRESYGFVCDPNNFVVLTGGIFPPQGTDSSYTPNTTCHWQIIPPLGQFITIRFTTNLTKPDSLWIIDNSGLMIKYGPDVTTDLYSPTTINLELLTATNGTLQFVWWTGFIPYDANAVNRVKLNATTHPTALLKSEVVSNTPYVVQSDTPMIIQTAAFPSTNSQYLMTSAFVYEGDGIGGKYLGSLYTFASATFGYTNITASTITVVSVTGFDYGIALVKSFASIQGYNVGLSYAMYQALGNYVRLDGEGKDFVYTLYNPLATDYYLNLTNFGPNSTASVTWTTGDLRSDDPFKVRDYTPADSPLFPQVIPGQLNTFIVKGGTVMLGFGFDKPNIFDHVPDGTNTIFISRNFPYKNLPQAHQVTYQTDYPARAAVLTNFGKVGNGITVKAAYGNGTSITARAMFGDVPLFLYGNKFTFIYDNATADPGAGATIVFRKTEYYQTTTPKAGQVAFSFLLPAFILSLLMI